MTGEQISLVVRPAHRAYLDRRDNRPMNPTPMSGRRLYISELGYCLRRAVLRILGFQETIPFDPTSREYMQYGIALEDDMGKALRHHYGENAVSDQVRLSNAYWSGKSDFILWHVRAGETEEATDWGKQPVIIEHKGSGSKWWNYNGALPKDGHLLQLWLYGQLYEEIYGVRPRLVLFYRGWGEFAEFELQETSNGFQVRGAINDEPVMRPLSHLSPYTLRSAAEHAFSEAQVGVLPDRLKDKREGCTFRGRPDCPMYYHCWDSAGNEHTARPL